MSNKDLILIFPDTKNGNLLYEACAIAIDDDEFMEADDKIAKAVEGVIPKGTLSATFKRLQKYGKQDYLVNIDDNTPGYTAENRKEKIKKYVTDRFQSYMDDPKTSKRAMRLYNAAFPPAAEVKTPESSAGD